MSWDGRERRKKCSPRIPFTQKVNAVPSILITIAIAMLGSLTAKQDKMEERLFKHFTNEEIHIPRSTVVTKAEFDIINRINENRFIEVRDELRNICLKMDKMAVK